MANLSLTLRCNQTCDYCFARGLAGNAMPDFMSRETFAAALDFLARSGIREARLLGGEPTLHPEAAEMIEGALARGFQVLVFSNGLIPDGPLERFADLPADRFSVLVNATGRWGDSSHGRDAHATPLSAATCQLERTLAALGPRAMLGVNLCGPAIELSFLLDWVDQYHLKRGVRLGLAHPSLSGGNRFLHPKFYPLVGEVVAEFAEESAARDIALELDCGFVPCMFPERRRRRFPQLFEQAGRRCNPIPDLLPDGRFVPCFPLAALDGVRLDQAADTAVPRSHFAERLAPLTGIGIYPRCAACAWFRDRSCLGGCRAAAFLRLRSCGAGEPVAMTADLAKASDVAWPSRPCAAHGRDARATSAVSSLATAQEASRARIWVLPYIDQPLEFWERLREDFGDRIVEVYFPLPGRLIGSGRPPQPEAQLDTFLRKGGLPAGVLVNPVVFPKPLDTMVEPILESLRRLRGEHGVGAVTVSLLTLATRIREALPDMVITASTLMDVSAPDQTSALQGVCDRLVPASRIMRDLAALRALRAAFPGRIRLIVNEGCLPGCPFRTRHFTEMASLGADAPESLCNELLERRPWLRLTTSWALPQHLRFYDGVYDELKLAGRVTLRDPQRYRSVVTSYVYGLPTRPHEIGAGPASVTRPMEIDEEFFKTTLQCDRRCAACHICEKRWASQG